MKFKATSYAMGSAVASVTFEAVNQSAAVMHPAINDLPHAGQPGAGPKAASRSRVVGIKKL